MTATQLATKLKNLQAKQQAQSAEQAPKKMDQAKWEETKKTKNTAKVSAKEQSESFKMKQKESATKADNAKRC